jgi:hypothetical protein
MDHYAIDGVGWYDGKGVTYDVPARFRALVQFLTSSGLVRPGVKLPAGDMPPDFELRSDHLTDEGIALIKAAYDKWVSAIDRGKPPTDVSILERALSRMRGTPARSAK